jgi:hypothetical protein
MARYSYHKFTADDVKVHIEAIKQKMITSKRFLIKCLFIINENQTLEEKKIGATIEKNHVGWRKFDGKVMSNIIKQYHKTRTLSDDVLELLRKRLSYYAKQIWLCMSMQQLKYVCK